MSTTPAPRTPDLDTFAARLGVREEDAPHFVAVCRRVLTAERLWARVHDTPATRLWARVHGYPPSPFRRAARRAYVESLRARVETFRATREEEER